MTITVRRLLIALTGAVALGAVWFLFAPPALGGSTSYVVTHGTSMEPKFHDGDLVLVRRQESYRVGQVAAYRSRTLNTVVLHRIVARDGNRYVFKGDRNGWLDHDRPTSAQILGAAELHVGGLGGKLKQMGTPVVVAILSGIAVLLLGSGVGWSRHRRRRGRARKSPRPVGEGTAVAAVASAVALLVFGALAAVAFTRPTTATASAAEPYLQTGSFAYSAYAPAGVVYPGGRVRTGDPVFFGQVDRLRIRFDYRLHSVSPRALRGSAALDAEVAGSNGWQRTIALEPATPFRGDRTTVAGTLELARLQSLLRRVTTATGNDPSLTYTLAVAPSVQLGGSAAKVSFAPRLDFVLDHWELRPVLVSGSGPHATNALKPVASGDFRVSRPVAAVLSFRVFRARVTTVRWASFVGAGAAGELLLVCCLLLLRGRKAAEPDRIRARYGRLLVPVAQSDHRRCDEFVAVGTVEALAQLAMRYDRMILYEQIEDGHLYSVAEDGVLYVYLSPGSEPIAADHGDEETLVTGPRPLSALD